IKTSNIFFVFFETKNSSIFSHFPSSSGSQFFAFGLLGLKQIFFFATRNRVAFSMSHSSHDCIFRNKIFCSFQHFLLFGKTSLKGLVLYAIKSPVLDFSYTSIHKSKVRSDIPQRKEDNSYNLKEASFAPEDFLLFVGPVFLVVSSAQGTISLAASVKFCTVSPCYQKLHPGSMYLANAHAQDDCFSSI